MWPVPLRIHVFYSFVCLSSELPTYHHRPALTIFQLEHVELARICSRNNLDGALSNFDTTACCSPDELPTISAAIGSCRSYTNPENHRCACVPCGTPLWA